MNFDRDLLDLFSKMVDDEPEKLILQLLFTKKDIEEMLDELLGAVEYRKDD